MKKTNKIIAIVILVLLFFSSFQNIIYGATEISKASLTVIQESDSQIQFKFSSGWGNVRTNYIGYREGGNVYPAYCISHGDPGVDELGDYTVSIEKTLDDVRLWRTIINGFPYKTPSQLGVESELDAYVATKQAIYCVILGRDVYSLYRGRTTRGNKIVDAIYRLTDIGRNGSQTPQNAQLSISKSGNLYEEGNYYVQKFNVSSAVNIASYTITNKSIPSGAIITNASGTQKTTFSGNESCYLKIPKSALNDDIKASITIQGKCKTYPVFYGQTSISGAQNYAVTFDPYGDEVGQGTLNLRTNNAKVVINKTDVDTNEPIPNTTFQLLKTDGTVVANATTNSKGVAEFTGLYQNNYILKEISSNEQYVLESNEQNFYLSYGQTKTFNITNKHKLGNLKVTKVDKDNNQITLGGVKFDLYSYEFDKVIGTYTTDANGEIIVKDLRTRKLCLD